MIELSEIIKLFVCGYTGGMILSVVPYLIGCLLDFAFAITHEGR